MIACLSVRLHVCLTSFYVIECLSCSLLQEEFLFIIPALHEMWLEADGNSAESGKIEVVWVCEEGKEDEEEAQKFR